MILGLYGSGGLGRGLYDMITRTDINSKWDKVIFINDFDDEKKYYETERIHFSSVKERFQTNEIEFLVSVGEPQDRRLLANRIIEAGYKLATYVDDTAIVSPSARITEGVIVCPFSIVDSQVLIGGNALIEHQCVIGHDSVIGKNSVISSHSIIGGFSHVGDTTFLGLSTVLKDRIKIGNGAIVAMGSVVFRDVEDNMTVAGNPARITKGCDSRRAWN